MTEVLEWISNILSRGSDWTDTQQHYKVSRLLSSQFMLYFGLSVSHCFTLFHTAANHTIQEKSAFHTGREEATNSA